MNIGHAPLYNPITAAFIDKTFANLTYNKISSLTSQEFEQAWRSWLEASSFNIVDGLEDFEQCVFIPGTTDAFGEFISRHPERRIRVSRSDFVLTKILSHTYKRYFLPIEDEPLNPNDCYIVSLPFSGNGSIAPDFDTNLRKAEALDVPVFLDAAYFCIGHGYVYPLHYRCITDFVTSLSKGISGKPLRLGVRFTRKAIDDGASAAMVGMDTFDRLGAYLSIQLLNNFSHDWFMEQYLEKSKEICRSLGLSPTKVVTLGLGDDRFIEFKRGDYIRVCISEELSQSS
jgi:hypothetical protein